MAGEGECEEGRGGREGEGGSEEAEAREAEAGPLPAELEEAAAASRAYSATSGSALPEASSSS